MASNLQVNNWIINVHNRKKGYAITWLRGLLREDSNRSEVWKSTLAKILPVYFARALMCHPYPTSARIAFISARNKTDVITICCDCRAVNPLGPKDTHTHTHTHTHIYIYICRTAQLTSRPCILNIYSTNILTEYFKYATHSPFFLFKMPFIS